MRLSQDDITIVDQFQPWWVKCAHCSKRAMMWPKRDERRGEQCGECKCQHCGALYEVPLRGWAPKLFEGLPLWLKRDFRGHVFWALNGEHLNYLERVVTATLREEEQFRGKRIHRTTAMPFNLPAWLLSAKNRPDLIRLINRLRKSALA